MPSTLPGRHRVSRRARLLDAWSGGPGVDAVATALVLAASRRSVSALSHDRTDPSGARNVRACGGYEDGVSERGRRRALRWARYSARAPRPWRLRSPGGRASCECSGCSSGGRRGLTSRRPAAGGWWRVRGLCMSRAVAGVQHVEKRADLEVAEGGAAQVRAAVDLVTVAPSDLGSLEVSLGDEVGHDPLSGALGDADLLCEVTGPAVAIASDAQQDVGVVAEEHPAGRFVGRSVHDEISAANFLARFSTRETEIVLR